MRRTAALTLLLAILVGSMVAAGARNADIRTIHGDAGGVPVSIYTTGAQPAGAIVLAHGAGMSRVSLRYLGYSLARQGFDVYIPDMPGHGVNRARLGEDAAVQTFRGLVASLAHDRVALAGHGTGAGVVWQAAQGLPRVRAVVLLSPAVPPGPAPPNPLALGAERDAQTVRDTVTALAGGEQQLGEIQGDFREGSARQGAIVGGRGHLSMLFDPNLARTAAGWVHAAFGTQAPGAPAGRYTTPVAPPGFEWLALSLAAAAGIVFAAISIVSPRAEYATAGRGAMRAPRLNMFAGLLLLALAALAAVLMGAWLRPFAWIRLTGADYVLGYFVFMAIVLFGFRLLWPNDYDFFGGPWADLGSIGLVRGLLLAGIALVAFGPVLHTSLVWFLPSGSRLLPLLAMAPGLWLFFVQEEALKRAVAADLSHHAALVVALLGKVVVVATWVGAALLPNPPSDVLAALLVPLAGVLLVLELFASALDRNGYPISAGAAFKALLLAWCLAVSLPVI